MGKPLLGIKVTKRKRVSWLVLIDIVKFMYSIKGF